MFSVFVFYVFETIIVIFFGYDMQEHSCQQLDNRKFK
jgi:hypothetical protein